MYNFSVVPPVAPENLTVIRIDYTILNVSWTPLSLSEAQGIILSYQLLYVRISWNVNIHKKQTNASANTSYILIGGLSHWRQYKVSIAAVTTAGVGKFSDFVYEDGEYHCILSITDIIPCRKSNERHKRDYWRIVCFDYIIFN